MHVMSDTTKVTVSACGYMNAYIKLQLKSFFLSSGGNSFKRRLAACCLQRQHSKKQNVLKKLDGPHKHSCKVHWRLQKPISAT